MTPMTGARAHLRELLGLEHRQSFNHIMTRAILAESNILRIDDSVMQ